MSDKPNILPNDGGFAFPGFWLEGSPSGNWTWKSINQGMSLRDYFAAAAIQGMLASTSLLEYIADEGANANSPGTALTILPERAYLLADAMIAARQPKP